MEKNTKKILILLIAIIVVIIGFSSVLLFKYLKKPSIDKVLESDSYSYLPVEAKNFLKEYYAETKNVLLTEKNKKEGELYLNPEYIDYLLLSQSEKNEISINNIPKATVLAFGSKVISNEEDLPSSFDLRNVNGNNYVAPVRDQGNFNICWAFATAGCIESHAMLKNNDSYSSKSQWISEREFDYGTSSNGLNDYTTPYKNLISHSLGDGSRFDATVPLLSSGASIWSYSDFKEYSDKDVSKMEVSEVLRNDKSQYELMESDQIGLNTYRESTQSLTDAQRESRTNYLNYVKTNIMNNGAIYLGVHMSSNCIHTDSSTGLLLIDVASNSNNNTSCTTTTKDGHAMEIIGWDDNKEYSYCITGNSTSGYYHYACSSDPDVTGKGAWIVKNSWGEDSNPYLYIAYDSYLTELNAVKSIKSSNNRDWDNNYYLGTNNINYAYSNRTFKASDTRLVGKEKVVRVKAYSDVSTANYTLRIVDSEGLTHTYTKSVTNSGLFYFDINDDVIIDNTSTFSLNSSKNNSFLDSFSIFTKNTNNDKYIDTSIIAGKKVATYNKTSNEGTAKRYYFNTKNINDGTELTFKLYDFYGNDVSSKLVVGPKSNIVTQNAVNALLTFNIANEKGNYTFKIFDGLEEIASCKVIVSSMTGTGTLSDPLIITTPDEFFDIRFAPSLSYKIANDLDFANYTKDSGMLNKRSNICSDGYGFESINDFSGNLDGNGKTIKNLRQDNHLICTVGGEKVDDYNYYGNGLFSNVYEDATITNLNIEDISINCSGGYCGTLISNYKEYKNEDNSSTPKHLTINDVTIKNSIVNGNADINNDKESLRKVYGGGLIGNIDAPNSYINLKNIYVGYNLEDTNIYNKGLLVSNINGQYTTISDIQLSGKLIGNKNDSSGDGILNYKINSSNLTINNILSTVKAFNVKGSLFGEISSTNKNISNLKTIAMEDKSLCDKDSDCSNISYFNEYDLDSNFDEFSKSSNYSSWTNFSTNWRMDVISEVNRLPFIKKVNMEYTSINDFSIEQELTDKYNIYDYINPKTMLSKNIIINVIDKDILEIDNNGNIELKSSGIATVNIKSLYDGFIKDIHINVTYVPHYTINLSPNGGVGESSSNVYSLDNEYVVPECTYTHPEFVFKGWNTRADGTGIRFYPGVVIKDIEDKDVITLYAQWGYESYDIESDLYDVDNDNLTIDLIPLNTTVSTFFDNIDYYGFTVEVESKDINGTQQLFTGGKTKIFAKNSFIKEYTNIVRGDVNGNGIIDIIDYIRIRKDIMEEEKLSGVYLKAADFNQNNTIDIIDYIRIRKIIMEEE